MKEMEEALNHQQDMNRTLEDQINKSRAKDVEYQDRMESTSHELQAMKNALRDQERKVQVRVVCDISLKYFCLKQK